MDTLTYRQTAAYESRRQRALGALTAQERAANILLDAAAQTDPARSTKALHVAMYAARMGAVLEAGPARWLWLLGLLSSLEPEAAERYAVFGGLRRALSAFRSGTGPGSRLTQILRVANTFADAVEEQQHDGTRSPADAIRMMLACRDLYDQSVVQALRTALTRTRTTRPIQPSTTTRAA